MVFVIASSAMIVKADTITFTMTSPPDSSTPGEVVSFSLQQGQAPDLLEACGCGGSPGELNAISAYFNVPILVNGVSEIGTINFCDSSCDNFTIISAEGPLGGLSYLGGNSEPWTGLLSAPQFIPGTYQSLTDCGGEFVLQCDFGGTPSPNTYPLLTIADTPEDSTFAMVFLGILFVFTVRRENSQQKHRKN
jgi:hypothetical protein